MSADLVRFNRLVAFAKQSDPSFVLSPDTAAVLGAVAALENEENASGHALSLGRQIGFMAGSDAGALFRQLTEHVVGVEMAPHALGIEALLCGLKDKFEKGWRLVPPPEEPAE